VIKPSEKHIEAILKIGPQTSKKGVRALIGLTSYHRSLIPDFAGITHCLTELLKKGEPEKHVHWGPPHSEALAKIQKILTSKPVLAPPIFDGAPSS